MQVLLISVIILIIYKVIALLQFKVSKPTSDHGYHIGLINSIKENKHRFVLGHRNYIENKNFMYPQFFHWMLSYIPINWIKNHYQKISQIITFFTIYSLLAFAKMIHTDYSIGIDQDYFLFLVGIFFILTPFNYLLWNAKNRGLSVRAFGLLCAFLFQFVLYFYVKTNSIHFLVILCLIALLILLSSQFALQFILLSTPIYCLFFGNFYIALPLVIAPLLFFILMPRVAKSFFIGQFWHKYMFVKFLAPVYFLNRRPSIWRDFIYDFWKKRDLKYVLDNAFISIFIFVPIFSLVTIDFIFHFTGNDHLQTLYIFTFVPALITIITSFRFSRFLGEPERYIEFSLPFATIIGIIAMPNQVELVILAYSFLLIIIHFSLYGFNNENISYHQATNKLKHFINKNGAEIPKKLLFSNNIYFLHYFIDEPDIKILMPNITHPYTANIHFKNICPADYGVINEQELLPLISHFKINWFILENTRLTAEEFQQHLNGLNVNLVATFDSLTLFNITHP